MPLKMLGLRSTALTSSTCAAETPTLPPHSGIAQQQTIQVYHYLCLLYFLTMLRSSNLIAKSAKDVDLKMILCWEDVKPLRNNINNGIVIAVPKSKNNHSVNVFT